jgi:transcriptional regulator with XRE-family HTH domain
MAVLIPSRTTVNSKDEAFFKALGARIAEARKERNLTQQQVADQLGITQQTLANYEVGNTRFPASVLPLLGEMLGLAPEELLGMEAAKPKLKRGPASRLDHQMEQIRQLPRTKQRFVMEMLDTVIAQAGH